LPDWATVLPLNFEYIGFEVNPAMANIVSPSEVVVVSTFHIELDGGGGDLHITIPYSMIEPVREELDSGVQSDVDDIDERWVRALRADIMEAKIPLNVKVVDKDLTLGDIVNLEPGDIIPVDLPDYVTLQANGVPVYKCKMGRSGENLALKVKEQVRLVR
jgi:flagellar motor switch protein FliM